MDQDPTNHIPCHQDSHFRTISLTNVYTRDLTNETHIFGKNVCQTCESRTLIECDLPRQGSLSGSGDLQFHKLYLWSFTPILKIFRLDIPYPSSGTFQYYVIKYSYSSFMVTRHQLDIKRWPYDSLYHDWDALSLLHIIEH